MGRNIIWCDSNFQTANAPGCFNFFLVSSMTEHVTLSVITRHSHAPQMRVGENENRNQMKCEKSFELTWTIARFESANGSTYVCVVRVVAANHKKWQLAFTTPFYKFWIVHKVIDLEWKWASTTHATSSRPHHPRAFTLINTFTFRLQSSVHYLFVFISVSKSHVSIVLQI